MNSPPSVSGTPSNTVVVFPLDRSGIGVLVVPPPYPVGYKPQPDGSLGINRNMVHDDRDGLLIYLLAYLNMAVGDFIRVYIETKNAPVVEFSITDAHFDSNGIAKDIPFHIPADDMHDKFAPLLSEKKDIWVEVRRISDNSTEDSPHALLFYKHPVPGEPDTDGGKPFNQGLKLPDASESLIDQTVIDDGMFVTIPAYFNQQIGDTVVLAFGSLLLEIEVTALGDVRFELTPEMLATLKPTNTIIVRWEVFDVVENSSGWSDSLVIVFKPGIVLLAPPIFEQADINNVVHHDWLAGASMSILITGVFAIGDVVVLLLEGVTEGGDSVSHSYSIPVAAATRSLRVDVENYRVQNVIRGSLRATYTQNRAGKIQQSKPADAIVAGGAFKLGQPTVTPLENNDTVPVDTVEVTVQFPEYWPLKPGAIVELLWQTVDDEGIRVLIILQQIVTDPTQPIVFKIPAKYIGRFPGSALTVQCAVTNPGEVRVVSEPLPLKIGDEKAIVLDPPTLVGAPAPIDPLAGARTMRVEFAAKITGDQARLVHVKAPVGSAPFALEVLNQNNRANWSLDNTFLVANNGKTVRLRWNLRRKIQKVASSRGVDLEIMPIAPADARLPMVKISGVEGVVDVQKLTAANRLVADAWIGQREGQARHLQLIGTANNGKETIFDVFKGEPTGEEKGLDAPVPIPWFRTLKDNSTVHLALHVNVDGSTSRETALKFPPNSYLVDTLDEKQPVITKVLDAQGREIPQNSETITTTVRVHVNGTPDKRIKLLLNGALQTTVTTDKAGNASANVSAGSFDAYNHLIAQAEYGQNLSSPPRSWLLRRALQIDTTRRLLKGYRVYTGWAETGAKWIDNWLQLSPSFGVGKRTFTSSNPSVVSVDANGVVTGLRCGAAYIYVQDQFSSFAIYVDSINIFTLAILPPGMTHAQSVQWLKSVPGSIPLTHVFGYMRVVYGPEQNWPLAAGWTSWMCDDTACPPNHVGFYVWKGGGYLCTQNVNNHYWPWCLRPH
ncbi:Ig-like domain-containing protein [Pseudomonas sp. TWP3-1]|uniref:Ig-like domain-containing protein n=1 Tax=Pseudomonas sp. TWP3-1 TaxID=2804631 RepID=UPI003CF676F1